MGKTDKKETKTIFSKYSFDTPVKHKFVQALRISLSHILEVIDSMHGAVFHIRPLIEAIFMCGLSKSLSTFPGIALFLLFRTLYVNLSL